MSEVRLRKWALGYLVDGEFYRRTVEAETLDAAVEALVADRPGAEVVSVYEA